MRQIIAAFMAALVMAGYGTDGTDLPKEPVSVSENGQTQIDAKPSASPGSYTVPEGWVKAEGYSNEYKVFYTAKGHENDEQPDNISVNFGSNPYSLEEHEDFRDAIMRQLLFQVRSSGVPVNGQGSRTAHGDVLYIFTIDEGSIVTKQYYIVKDYGFCLIHVTNFTGSEEVYDVAQAMIDSFVWNEA